MKKIEIKFRLHNKLINNQKLPIYLSLKQEAYVLRKKTIKSASYTLFVKNLIQGFACK
jgi:hypothetical protein